MSGGLFVGSSGCGSGAGKHLVEFRAGRLSLRDGVVTADRRKGLLYLFQGDDALLHFCWRDRTTGHVEDDYILFPGDCEYARVPQCTTGRVYVLKFTASNRRLFFWMQEPKTDKDEEYCRRINEVLNNPPSASSGRSGSGGGTQDGELQNILNNMSQQQLMQLFGGVGHMGGLSSLLSTMGRSPTGQSSRSSSGTPTSRPPLETPRAPSRPPRVAPVTATTPTTPSAPNTPSTQTQQPASTRGQPIHLSDLQKYLSGLTNASSEEGSTSRSTSNEVVDLASVISTPEVIATAGPHAAGLMEHLPRPSPDQQQDDIKTTLLSPQFAQAMSLFSNAIASGQLGPIISQFGLGSDAVTAAQNGDMKAFVKALEKEESKTAKAEDSNKPKDKDEDDNMALD